jgi:hypothetical protein
MGGVRFPGLISPPNIALTDLEGACPAVSPKWSADPGGNARLSGLPSPWCFVRMCARLHAFAPLRSLLRRTIATFVVLAQKRLTPPLRWTGGRHGSEEDSSNRTCARTRFAQCRCAGFGSAVGHVGASGRRRLHHSPSDLAEQHHRKEHTRPVLRMLTEPVSR